MQKLFLSVLMQLFFYIKLSIKGVYSSKIYTYVQAVTVSLDTDCVWVANELKKSLIGYVRPKI